MKSFIISLSVLVPMLWLIMLKGVYKGAILFLLFTSVYELISLVCMNELKRDDLWD